MEQLAEPIQEGLFRRFVGRELRQMFHEILLGGERRTVHLGGVHIFAAGQQPAGLDIVREQHFQVVGEAISTRRFWLRVMMSAEEI